MVRRIVIGILVIGELGMKWISARVGWVIPTVKGTRNNDHTSSRKDRTSGVVKMGLMGAMVPMAMVVMMSTTLWAAESADVNLDQQCLQCHQEQKIPSDLIYRRYLMRYSTSDRIEKAMLAYLENPKRSRSIMPPQFFLKFPMKHPMQMSKSEMIQNIRAYIERFDVRKRLSFGKSEK